MGATGIPIDANVTVTFSELLNPATVDGNAIYLRAQGASTNVPAAVTLAANVVTITPSAQLEKGKTYTVTVKSTLADPAGNLLGADASWSFSTVPDSITDTTVADFSAGITGACVVDEAIGNGALRLPMTVEENFSETSMPAGWSSGPWGAGGTEVVSGGALTVDGGRGYTNLSFGPGRSLEFRATFSAATYQNVGFAGDGSFNAPWIAIGEDTRTDGVYARMNSGESVRLSTTTLGAPHVYRIDWTASGFAFYVDGALATTIAREVTSNMVVIVSDAIPGGGTLAVDWVRVTPYISPCTFESRILYAGFQADWLDLTWSGVAPAGSVVSILTRSGNTATPDTNWTDWAPLNGTAIPSAEARYLQYQLILSTSDPQVSAVVESVTVSYIQSGSPTAVTLASFSGSSSFSTVRLDWETANEVGLIGFNLYRTGRPDEAKQKLNPDLILAQYSNQMMGAAYQFSEVVEQGTRYYYWLELVRTGETELIGPVVVDADYMIGLPLIIR